MDKQDYRTANTPSGSFRKLSTIHMHIDGGGHINLKSRIEDKIRELETKGFIGKSNTIINAVKGLQRDHPDYLETYDSHTPGSVGFEQFEIFSTSCFGKLDSLNEKFSNIIRNVIEEFKRTKGIVIEVERVFASIDKNGIWRIAPVDLIESIDERTIQYKRSNTHPIEIHHAFDVPKSGLYKNQSPITLTELKNQTGQLNIRVGGWFIFEKAEYWAYRSSQFSQYENYKETSQEYHRKLNAYLKEKGIAFELWTMVEQVLGIWKTGKTGPATRSTSKLTVPQLARWEGNCKAKSEFWVVAGNFLGDIDPDIRYAMLRNLKKGVNYTYFLRSFADLRRLRELVNKLSKTLGFDVSDNVKPVLLWVNEKLDDQKILLNKNDDYFINAPGSPKERVGYQIKREDSKRKVNHGVLMSTDALNDVIENLAPILKTKNQGIVLPIIKEDLDQFSVLFTDLEDSVSKENEADYLDWIPMLNKYDEIVAREVSKLGGTVIKSTGDGYISKFKDPLDCFRCAINLQRALAEHNYLEEIPNQNIPKQRIGVDYGSARRVERADGYDYSGPNLSRCSRVMSLAKGDHILLSQSFVYQAKQLYHSQKEFQEIVKKIGSVKLKGLDEDIIIYELIWSDNDGNRITPLKLTDIQKRAKK